MGCRCSSFLTSHCIHLYSQNTRSLVEAVKSTPRTGEDILDSLLIFNEAVAYIADASTEAVRFSARFTVLINEARQALWLKSLGRGYCVQILIELFAVQG